jgi:hypothetical protein
VSGNEISILGPEYYFYYKYTEQADKKDSSMENRVPTPLLMLSKKQFWGKEATAKTIDESKSTTGLFILQATCLYPLPYSQFPIPNP